MRETIKIVNGYAITRMVGCKGFYTVQLNKVQHVTFRTIKAATEYCNNLATR